MGINDGKPELVRIMSVVQESRALMDRGEAGEARRRLAEARKSAEAIGIRSSCILCNLAVAADQLDEPEQAFILVSEAALLDPMDPQIETLFVRLAATARGVLADPTRKPDDASTPRLYELLSRAGETDVACHLALARFFLATEKPGDATKIVDALTLLAPASVDAWRFKAVVARARNDEALAQSCEKTAALKAQEPVPFGIPGVQGEC